MRKNLEQRFMEKVSPCPNTGCWFWTGACTTHKWGGDRPCLYLDGYVQSASRAAFVLFKGGPVSEGLYALHTCNVILCVNPDHLYAGTQQQNMDDLADRGYSWSGEGVCNTKLTEAQVVRIRFGEERSVDLVQELGVSRSTVNDIRKNRSWKHVTSPFVL